MGCACNNKSKENLEQKVEPKKEYKKKNIETFDINSFISTHWIYILIVLIILILIYVVIAKPFSSNNDEMREFILAPPGFIRGNLDEYTVGM